MSTAIDLAERFDSLDKLKQAIEAEASAYFRHDEKIKQACQLLASQDITAEARTKCQLQGIDYLRGCDAVRFIPAYFQQWATNDHDRDAAVMGEMMNAAIKGDADVLKQLNELVDRLPDRNIMAQIQAAFGRTLAEAILRRMRPELREQGLAKVNEEVSRLKLTRNDVTDLADAAGISDGARHFIRCIEKAWRGQEADAQPAYETKAMLRVEEILEHDLDSAPQLQAIEHQLISIGDRQYKKDEQVIVVTEKEDTILQSFLKQSSMDFRQLLASSGYEDARKVLKKLTNKYDGFFSKHIFLPGGKSRGGYRVELRSP